MEDWGKKAKRINLWDWMENPKYDEIWEFCHNENIEGSMIGKEKFNILG